MLLQGGQETAGIGLWPITMHDGSKFVELSRCASERATKPLIPL